MLLRCDVRICQVLPVTLSEKPCGTGIALDSRSLKLVDALEMKLSDSQAAHLFAGIFVQKAVRVAALY